MDVAIFGTGALGGVFAGYLSNAGHTVYCVDIWQEHIEAIAEDGLKVIVQEGSDVHAYPIATTDVSDVGPVDVAFVFVKSYDTASVLPDVAAVTGPETNVVTVQNGLGNYERIRECFGASSAFGGATTVGASLVKPGTVTRISAGETVIGGDDSAGAKSIVGLLDDAEFEAGAVDDPIPHIWRKQLINAGLKPVAVLTELKNGPMRETSEAAEVMRTLIEEATSVARTRGIEILSDDPVAETYEICEATFEKRSSMLEDVRKGRRTEIEYINGKVVAYGAEVGVPTPYNEVVTKLVKAKEQAARRRTSSDER